MAFCNPPLATARAVVVVLAAALACNAPAHADGDAPSLKLSVLVAPAFPLGHAAKAWSDRLGAAAGGAFTVSFRPGAALARGNARSEFEALEAGTIDLAVGSALFWSEALPALGAIGLPWIAPDDRQVAAVVGSDAVTTALRERLAARGLELVYWAPLAHRDLATQARPIAAPGDLRGLRVRVATTPVVDATLRALGATPSVLSYAAAQAALGAGTLDAQDGTAATFASARVWATGTRHVVEWGAFADAMLFVVRKPLWDAWPPALRDAVRAAAQAAARDADPAAAEAAARATLAAQGITVSRLTPAGHAAFRKAVQDVHDTLRPLYGAALVDAIEHAAREALPGDVAAPRAVAAPGEGAVPRAAAAPHDAAAPR